MLDVVVDRVAIEYATNGLAAWYCTDASDELPDARQPPQREASRPERSAPKQDKPKGR